MLTIIANEDLQAQELEQEHLLFKILDLPLFKYVNEVDNFFEDGQCKLRTLTQLEDLKAQYQRIYFNPSANAEGKKAVFHQLKKLSSRISRIRSDHRRFG